MHLIALCFFFHFSNIAFFMNRRLTATLGQANLNGISFPTVLTYFLSLCHILVPFTIFQKNFFTIISICYGDLCSVVFDVTTPAHVNVKMMDYI